MNADENALLRVTNGLQILVKFVASASLIFLSLGWSGVQAAFESASSHTGSIPDDSTVMDTEIVAGLVRVGGETEPWRAVEIVWSSIDRSTVLLTDCQCYG